MSSQVADHYRIAATMTTVASQRETATTPVAATTLNLLPNNDDSQKVQVDDGASDEINKQQENQNKRVTVNTSVLAKQQQQQEPAGANEEANKRQGAPSGAKGRDQKLRVVLPNEQKTLVTPTIITSDMSATPSQLFNSLVQLGGAGQEVSLFTGLPTYTPSSADGLATMNPFFWGVPTTFSASPSDMHGQQTDGLLAAANAAAAAAAAATTNTNTGGTDNQVGHQTSQQQVGDKLGEPARGAQQVTGENDSLTETSGNNGSVERRARPVNKLSFDHLHQAEAENGFQFILTSPYSLFLSPEHDALLRLGLTSHLQQHPLAGKTAMSSQQLADSTSAAAMLACQPQPAMAYISAPRPTGDEQMMTQNQQHGYQQQYQQQIHHQLQQQHHQQQQQLQQRKQQQLDQNHISAQDLTNQNVAQPQQLQHQQQQQQQHNNNPNTTAPSSISSGKPTAMTAMSYESQMLGTSPTPYHTYQHSQQQQPQQQYTLISQRSPKVHQLGGQVSYGSGEPGKIPAIFANGGPAGVLQSGVDIHQQQQQARANAQLVDPAAQYMYQQQLQGQQHEHQIETTQQGRPGGLANKLLFPPPPPPQVSPAGKQPAAGPPAAHHQHGALLVMSDSRMASEYHPSSRGHDGLLAMHYENARPLYEREQLRQLYLVQQQQSLLQPVGVNQALDGHNNGGQEQSLVVADRQVSRAAITRNSTQQIDTKGAQIKTNCGPQPNQPLAANRESVSSSNSLSTSLATSPHRPDQSSSACSSTMSRGDATTSIDVIAIPTRMGANLDGMQQVGGKPVSARVAPKMATKRALSISADDTLLANGAATQALATTTSQGDDGAVRKKSKGGRKKKQVTHEELMARKNRCKERNRVAAKRCRLKRKQFLDELNGRIDELNSFNKKLQRENAMLKGELEMLRKKQVK